MSNINITIESTDADGVRAAISKALPEIVAAAKGKIMRDIAKGNRDTANQPGRTTGK